MTVSGFLGMIAGWAFYGLLFLIAGGAFVVVLYAILRAARALWERRGV